LQFEIRISPSGQVTKILPFLQLNKLTVAGRWEGNEPDSRSASKKRLGATDVWHKVKTVQDLLKVSFEYFNFLRTWPTCTIRLSTCWTKSLL